MLSPDLAEGYIANVLGGIEAHLLQSHYRYFLATHEWSKNRIEQTLQMFLERGVDGVILINTPLTSEVELPLAVIGDGRHLQRGVSIGIDNHTGVRLALEHLVSLGHRRIAFIKGHKDSADTEDRWEAVLNEARNLSIKVDPKLVVQLERLGAQQIFAIEEGAQCGQQLLAFRNEFTALMAFNDRSAIGAMNCFRDHGLRIPQNVSVIGFDDVAAARIVFPALTTVQQPMRQVGETAAREVINASANGTKHHRLILTPQLVVRKTTAPVRITRSKRR